MIYKTFYCNIIIILRGEKMARTAIKINKKGDDGYKVISVRLKEGTLEKIDDLSLKSNRSRNEIINILLESSVEEAEVE